MVAVLLQVLVKDGPTCLRHYLWHAQPSPIPGLQTFDDYLPQVLQLYTLVRAACRFIASHEHLCSCCSADRMA